jgi:hypothetical protein
VSAVAAAALPSSASAAGWTISSAPASTGEAQAGVAPHAPSGPLAGCPSSSHPSIGLVWGQVSQASSYQVYVSTTSATGPYSLMFSGDPYPLYVTTSLAGNKTYWFEIQAQVGSNWSSPRSSASNSVRITSSGNCVD